MSVDATAESSATDDVVSRLKVLGESTRLEIVLGALAQQPLRPRRRPCT